MCVNNNGFTRFILGIKQPKHNLNYATQDLICSLARLPVITNVSILILCYLNCIIVHSAIELKNLETPDAVDGLSLLIFKRALNSFKLNLILKHLVLNKGRPRLLHLSFGFRFLCSFNLYLLLFSFTSLIAPQRLIELTSKWLF